MLYTCETLLLHHMAEVYPLASLLWRIDVVYISLLSMGDCLYSTRCFLGVFYEHAASLNSLLSGTLSVPVVLVSVYMLDSKR